MSDLSGRDVRGYKILEQVGAGGFGAVYRASQPLIKRDVAIKVILPEHANNPDFIRRFEVEAQVVAGLEHPRIVPLYDFWRDPEGAFLVMRWLGGGNLADLVRKEPLDLPTATRIVEQICEALHAAHRRGVIHRDLKPVNILLDEDQNAYLADFGIARVQGTQTETDTDQIQGTLAYISPEQIQGGDIKPATDIYSLGIMVFEILTGKRPFTGDNAGSVIFQHLANPIPLIVEYRPDLPIFLDDVLQKATAKAQTERYEDVMTFLNDFKRVSTAQAVSAAEGIEIAWDDAVDLSLGGTDTVQVKGNPYKGLRAFQEGDADEFFGRQALVEQLIDDLETNQDQARFLAVVGPSGSGKSSAVKAGLIPALRRGAIDGSENWFVTEMVPGGRPFAELEAALLRVAVTQPTDLMTRLRQEDGIGRVIKQVLPQDESVNLVLMIDQFEELFTLTTNEQDRRLFLDNIMAALNDPRGRLWLIITIRADFYDRPLQYLQFGELLRKQMTTVLPLSEEELRESIERPAENAGVRFESGLVDRILADIGEQPGVLPLLQYALTELFERREGLLLTMNAYDSIGGVTGALSRRADDIYTSLDADGQAAVRQMFLRLVTLGQGTQDTRRRVRSAELESVSDDMARVVDEYTRSRLLTVDRDEETRLPTVEVAHEALIRTWERLRDWLSEEREALQTQRRLTEMADEWEEMDEDPRLLASGLRLSQFEEWSQTTSLLMNEEEANFLQESLAARERQKQEEAERVARERQRERALQRFRVGIGVLLLLTLAAALAGALFINQQTQQSAATIEAQAETAVAVAATADAERLRAERNAERAQSLAWAAQAQQAFEQNDWRLAIGLALEANSIDDPPPIAQRTLADLAYARGPVRSLVGHEGIVHSVAFSPDSTTAASASGDGTVILWDLASGDILHTLSGHEGTVNSVAFHPDGTSVASGGDDGVVILWNVATGEILNTFVEDVEDPSEVVQVAFSADGSKILDSADGNRDQNAIITFWDVETGEYTTLDTGSRNVTLSTDGKAAATDEEILLLNAETSEPAAVLPSNDFIWSLALSPDESTILAGRSRGTLQLLDAETGDVQQTLIGHTDNVTSVAYSPDGKTVITSTRDAPIILWDVETGERLRLFFHEADKVTSLAFSPDGHTVMSGHTDRTVIVWDMESGAILREFPQHNGAVVGSTFNNNGEVAVSAGTTIGSPLKQFNVATGELIQAIPAASVTNANLVEVAFSPDGTRGLTSHFISDLFLWDLESGELIRQFANGHTGIIGAIALNSDGTAALSGSMDRTMILWDATTGETVRSFTGHTGEVTAVAFSPDGTIALSGSDDTTLILWNLETGAPERTFTGHTGTIRTLEVSPDGQTALSGADDNNLILWDIETGDVLRILSGHSQPVSHVTYSPDGNTALSSSLDGSIILWELSSGEILRTFTERTPVRGVTFSPDGRTFMSGAEEDGSLTLWRIDTVDELLTWTYANRYIQPFTCQERIDFSIQPRCDAEGAFPTRTPYPQNIDASG